MSDNERLIKRLSSLRKLALQGKFASEREAAQKLFDKLIYEYDVDLCTFDESEQIEKREFRFSGPEEEKLLDQTMAKVIGHCEFNMWFVRGTSGRKKPGVEFIECTKAQEIEIKFLFDFYKELWKEEKEKMLFAFIQKHAIAPEPKPGEGTSLSFQELLDLSRRMAALSDSDPVRRLEGK